MKIKTYPGYTKTKFVEVLEPLTINDFIIEETAPRLYHSGGYITTSLKLNLKSEVADNIMILLENQDRYGDESKGKVTSFYKEYDLKITYNGCKTQESKDKKTESVRKQAVVHMHDKKQERIDRLLQKAVSQMELKINTMNVEYERQVTKVLLGEQMDNEFIQEHLDDPELISDVDYLEKAIKALQEQKQISEDKLKVVRNDNMLKYLNENGWNDDVDENVVVVPSLQEKLTEAYKNGEGFEVFNRRWVPAFN